jgi:hypothetical protein
MKKNLLLLLIVTILGAGVYGQNKSFDELTLNLATLKPQVLPLEPIPFTLTLTNNTNAPVTVETALSFAWGGVRLEIKKPNGTVVVPPQNTYVTGRMIIVPKDLRPDEKLVSTEVFGFKIQDYFGQVGRYQVRATLYNRDGKTVRSGWVTINVEEPTSTDKIGYDYLKKKLDKHSDNASPFNTWDTDELEEFVLQHPGTTYADYARYTLGNRYFERDKEKAETHLRQIHGDFVFAEDVDKTLKLIESRKQEN